MKQPRLRKQGQILTSKVFEELVNFESRIYLYRKYLTDQRVQELFEKENTTEQKLLKEIRNLFFQSFYEILGEIQAQSKVYVTWYNTYDVIKSYEIVDKAYDQPSTELEGGEIKDIRQPIRNIWLNFNVDGRRRYMMLTERICLIMDYILTKHIFSKLLELARHVTPETFTQTTSDTHTKYIPIDWSPLLMRLGEK